MDYETRVAITAIRDHLDDLARTAEAEDMAIKRRLDDIENKFSKTSEVVAAATEVIKQLSNLRT